MYMYSNIMSGQLFMHVSTRLKNACVKNQVFVNVILSYKSLSGGKPKIEKMYIEGQVIEKVTEHRSW